MVPAERRSARDFIAVAIIIVLVVVTGIVVWWIGDSRQARLESFGKPTRAAEITREPIGLTKVWEAESPITAPPSVRGPLTAGGSVIIGGGHEVQALDPVTGKQVWMYTRQRPLCALETAWGSAITVWRYGHGCGDVMAINGDRGTYGASRSGESADQQSVVTGGQHVVSFSPSMAEVWRSDMVRTLFLGTTRTPLEPHRNIFPGCTFHSVIENDGVVAVLSKCPRHQGMRLTVLKAVPKEDTEPEIIWDWLTPYRKADLISVNDRYVLLYVPGRQPKFVRIARGKDHHAGPQVTEPAPRARIATIPAFFTDKTVYWADGAHLVAFDRETLRARWTLDDVTGTPAVLSALRGSPYWLVVPRQGGLLLVNGFTGTPGRLLKVAGAPISKVATISGMVIVQRGDKVIGLRPISRQTTRR